MRRRVISTPIGDVLLGAQSGRLCEVRIMTREEEIISDDDPVLDEAQRQIVQYLDGERRSFDLPLEMRGSAFDCAVWRMLQTIPYGEVWSYGRLAAALGKPRAFRAVGGACSRNLLLIVVPCHRVIAGSGKLTGFAAGLAVKKTLLTIEGWTIEREKVCRK